MSESKEYEQIEQENYDKMLTAMAEYTMHKDAQQYDDDISNDKTIDDYKANIDNVCKLIDCNEDEGAQLSQEESDLIEQMQDYLENHTNDEYEYVVRGALLHCDCGSHHRRLNLPECHGIYVGTNPLMRNDDCNAGIEGPDINITSFGICNGPGSGSIGEGEGSLATEIMGEDGFPIIGETDGGIITGNICKANFPIQMWENTHDKTQINEESKFVLTTNSFLKCKYGGIIRIVKSGQ